MIAQEQRWWRGPVFNGNGGQTDQGGDCFAACLASILELPIDGFPNFLASDYEGHWWHRWQKWLYDEYRVDLLYWDRGWPDPRTKLVWWIGEVMVGATPHSVVFYRDEFRWDPAPPDYKHDWSLDDVRSVVAPFSVASVFDREDGPPQLSPIVADTTEGTG